MAGFDLGLDAVAQKFRHELSRQTIALSDTEEFEVKYMATNGLATLSHILKHLPLLEFKHNKGHPTPKTDVSLLTPEFFYKDYNLANFGLDTLNKDGTPGFEIYQHGYQLRQRFSVRAYLPENHNDAVGVSQCSVKDLYSKDRASARVEIEKCMPGMRDSAERFIEAEKKILPGFFQTIAANRLCVSAAFLTARGSYLIGVHVPSYDALVAFEVSNDQTLNLTPNLLHVTRAYAHEWEAEAKQIFFTKSRKVVALNPERDSKVILGEAERILREYVTRRFGNEIKPAKKSKLERAMDDSHVLYEKMHIPFNDAAAGMPKSGAQYALHQGFTMGFIETQRSRLMMHAREMTSGRDLVSAPNITKTLFDVRAAERVAAPVLAHA